MRCRPSLAASSAHTLYTYGDWESRFGVASGFDPIPKMRRKREYFEAARRRFGSGWLISLKLSCILRQLRQSGPNQLYFDFIPAKKMATLLVLLHHLLAPFVSLPSPRIFLYRPLT